MTGRSELRRRALRHSDLSHDAAFGPVWRGGVEDVPLDGPLCMGGLHVRECGLGACEVLEVVRIFAGPAVIARLWIGMAAMFLHQMTEEAHPPSRMCEILGWFHGHFVEWFHDTEFSHVGSCVALSKQDL